ncbi:hypothetical protein ACO0LB_17195 [Undibacterium sp. SXout7W]|uniref:hypothetical protein n=1 Tax=Undibacterium sp. SXout7W TaxID=3413049 RepID=UPI003BF29E29
MVIVDATGLPLAVHTSFASPHEVPLSKQRSLKPSRWNDLNDLSGIVPTTVIDALLQGSHRRAMSKL